MKHFVSSGGLGDAFIVALKLKEWEKEKVDPTFNEPYYSFSWTHIESVDIGKPFEIIVKKMNFENCRQWTFEHNPNYIQNIKELTKDKEIIPTPPSSTCSFYNKAWLLKNPFLENNKKDLEYDIVLQCSAGVKNDRGWKDDPLKIAECLAATGRHVTIIGTDSRYKKSTTNTDKIINLVDRTSMEDALNIIERCNAFVGLSGFLTFYSMANKKPTIHLQQSKGTNETYIHSKWTPYFYNVENGTIAEVLKKVREIK